MCCCLILMEIADLLYSCKKYCYCYFSHIRTSTRSVRWIPTTTTTATTTTTTTLRKRWCVQSVDLEGELRKIRQQQQQQQKVKKILKSRHQQQQQQKNDDNRKGLAITSFASKIEFFDFNLTFQGFNYWQKTVVNLWHMLIKRCK